jgi:hypothetical protein
LISSGRSWGSGLSVASIEGTGRYLSSSLR